MPTIQAVRADITTLDVEAIVRVTDQPSQGASGDAQVITDMESPARFVIETVGPCAQGESASEAAIIASCYSRCIEVAEACGVRSIAIPEIGGSEGGVPIEEAAAIAIASVSAAVEGTPVIGEVLFCCHSRQTLQHFRAALMQPA